jgi:hypothetical protein
MPLQLLFTRPGAWMTPLSSAALALVAVVAPAAAAAADCPAAIVQIETYDSPPFPVEATTFDTTQVFGDYAGAQVAFDRTQATLLLAAQSAGRMSTSLRLFEALDVTGVAPGTPVNAMLEFRLDGWSQQSCGGSGCGVRLEGWLIAGQDSTSANANEGGPGGERHDIATTLSLPVTIVAGTPLVVHLFMVYGTGPGGDAEASLAGSYAVGGLPPGVAAVGCGGAQVTPVRGTTWGTLKTLYR